MSLYKLVLFKRSMAHPMHAFQAREEFSFHRTCIFRLPNIYFVPVKQLRV